MRMNSKVSRRLLAFASGLALPLMTIVLFKSTTLGRNYLIEYQHDTFAKILDFSRHRLILQNVVTTFISFGGWWISPLIPLLLFILFWGVDWKIVRNGGWTMAVMIIGILLSGYYFVYLVTPLDLAWQLDSSLKRLFIQVWPSALLLAGLVCRRVGPPNHNETLVRGIEN